MNKIENLLELLALHGGTIVSTASLKPNEIDQARAGGRMYVDSNLLGYIWMPSIDVFPDTIEKVEQFEKWFPLDEKLPDKLKNLDWFFKREPSHPTTLPSDEEIEKAATFNASDNILWTEDEEKIAIKAYSDGAKDMRSLCEAKLAEMESEMKRLRFMIDNGLGAKDIQNDI